MCKNSLQEMFMSGWCPLRAEVKTTNKQNCTYKVSTVNIAPSGIQSPNQTIEVKVWTMTDFTVAKSHLRDKLV